MRHFNSKLKPTAPRPTSPSPRPPLLFLLLILSLARLTSAPTHPAVVYAQDDPSPLQAGETISGNLVAGEAWVYPIEAGDIFTVRLTDLSVDVNTDALEMVVDFPVEMTEPAAPSMSKAAPTQFTALFRLDRLPPRELHITSPTDTAFTLTLDAGNTLVQYPSEELVAIGDTLSGTGSSDHMDGYTLVLPESPETTVFSLILNGPGDGNVTILDIPAFAVMRFGETYTAVYHVAFQTRLALVANVWNDAYTLDIVAGDVLTLSQGALANDTPFAGTLTPGKIDQFHLPALPGDLITVELEGDASFVLQNEATQRGRPQGENVIELPNGGPYYILVQGDGDYTLTISGASPIADARPLAIPVTAPYALEDPSEAVFTFDAEFGEMFVIQTIARGNAVRPFLVSTENFIDMPNEVRLTNERGATTTTVYRAQWDGSFFVVFRGEGDFIFTITRADYQFTGKTDLYIVQLEAPGPGMIIINPLPAHIPMRLILGLYGASNVQLKIEDGTPITPLNPPPAPPENIEGSEAMTMVGIDFTALTPVILTFDSTGETGLYVDDTQAPS